MKNYLFAVRMILQRKTQDDCQLFLKNGRAMKLSLALLMTGFRWKNSTP